MIARDWLKTLFRASYKGVPFWVQRDNERGSRRIVEHEFPMRDNPFLEDLGEGVRRFEITAYVASDAADREAAAIMDICAIRGAGVLVLPAHGPILVRCLEFSRDREKDRHGFIAHSLRFSREGSTSSLATVASLANLIFVQGDAIAIAAGQMFAGALAVHGQPDHVVEAARDGVDRSLATFEAIRTSSPVDPTTSASVRDRVAGMFDRVPQIIGEGAPVALSVLAADVVSVARSLSSGLQPAAAVALFPDVLIQSPAAPLPIRGPSSRLQATRNRNASALITRLAALAGYCDAIAGMAIGDRQTGITLRANVFEHFEAEIEVLPAEDIDLFRALVLMRDAVIDYLSRAILDLAPVVTVTANLSMPSLYWAWRMYKDPSRSLEIVARNSLPHPSFVPAVFEALGR